MWVDADTHFGGGRLSRIAKAADDTTRATTAGTPAQSRVEEMISRTGVEAQLALFRGFIDRAVGISTSASRIDAKLKRYDGRQPSRRTLAIGLAITTAAFVCGVVIPMLNPNASHILSADVPVAAYLVALLTAAEVMLRHRTK